MTGKVSRRTLKMCWIDIYLGPPNVIVHGAGKNFMAAGFQANKNILIIQTNPIPVEFANSMNVVDCYRSSIRSAYNVIKKEVSDIGGGEALQMAVKSINNSVWPECFVPKLLVFGALPSFGLPTNQPTLLTFQRVAAWKTATAEFSKTFANRQTRATINTRNGPDVSETHWAPIGTLDLVYCPEKEWWEGHH